MDDRTTVHMIAKVLCLDGIKKPTQNDVFNSLIEVDKSFICEYLIYYYRIINEDGVTIALRNIFNNRLEDLEENELISLFDDYGCNSLLNTLCEVLKGFHSMNIICGAIKLSNIIMKNDNKNDKYFYLCDYCMKVDNNNDDNVNYVSPEEIYGKEIGVEVDIWCVGILLYYILSGFYPFESGNEVETKRNIERMEIPPLKIGFSEIMNGLIGRMLQKNPSSRITIFELDDYIHRINNIICLNIKTENNYSINNVIVEEKSNPIEEEEERKIDNNNNNENDGGNSTISSLIFSITRFAYNKAEMIKSKSENISNYYKSEIAKKQSELQADLARRQAEIASKQAEIELNLRRKQAEMQLKIANIKSYLPNHI